jgi:uncharacterized protein (DUF2062 family)
MLSMQSESTMSVDRELSVDSDGTIAQLSVETRSPVFGLKRFARRAWDWMNPFRIWREVRLAETARRDFAAGLAIGVFIACVPLYGLQTILGLFAARRLSLHPLPILAGTQLSAPPFAPALTVVSVVIGHAVVTGKLLHLTDFHVTHLSAVSMAAVNSFVVSWLIGGALLGTVLAGIIYMMACAAMHLMFSRANSQSGT